jgi:NTP pyrophosphatase (non-canonical NTP hydrolase)
VTLNEYQEAAVLTLQGEVGDEASTLIALLGLAGETGELLTLYKKFLRDGPSFEPVNERLREELGDVLWYVSTLCSHFRLDLSEVASANLAKTASRWTPSNSVTFSSLDENFTESERLPRIFAADFKNSGPRDRQRLEVFIDGQKCGSTLTDNSYASDDYRYHDLLHLSLATVLGWSPVLRALLHRKRKSSPIVDEVEDGGRAVAIEEGLAALIFNYAKQHSLLNDVKRLDWPLLKTCHEMTRQLEVSVRSLNDWEDAIMQAFEIWREMQIHNGGRVVCNLDSRRLRFVPAGEMAPADAQG